MKNINLRDVNPDLHKAFKDACELKGHTMRWVLITLMQKYIDEYATPKVKTIPKPNGTALTDGEKLPF